ncbi:hypothetical protein ON010_g9507 [Phytophthora cinnamomi]|nr:hypothetical protein ON010_g9507 [Phytophthora cinnamomi]
MVTVAKQLSAGGYEFPGIPEFDPEEAKVRGFSPFKRADGCYSARGPATEIDDEDPKYRKYTDERLAEDLADAEAKSAEPQRTESEAFSSEEEENEE